MVKQVKTVVSANVPAETPAVKVPVVHQSKDEVAQAAKVQGLAIDIIRQTGELAGKYLALCLYIRQEKVSPKLVSHELRALGFKKSRVSEINRVSHSSDKLFTEYQAKMIGFDRCLELARIEVSGQPATVTKAAHLLVAGGAVTESEVDDSIPSPASSSSPAVGGPTDSDKIKKWAEMILEKAVRPSVHRLTGSKFEVVIRASSSKVGGNVK